LFALEPAPERQQPAAQNESEPEGEKPGPGAGLSPAERFIEKSEPENGKTVQWRGSFDL